MLDTLSGDSCGPAQHRLRSESRVRLRGTPGLAILLARGFAVPEMSLDRRDAGTTAQMVRGGVVVRRRTCSTAEANAEIARSMSASDVYRPSDTRMEP